MLWPAQERSRKDVSWMTHTTILSQKRIESMCEKYGLEVLFYNGDPSIIDGYSIMNHGRRYIVLNTAIHVTAWEYIVQRELTAAYRLEEGQCSLFLLSKED